MEIDSTQLNMNAFNLLCLANPNQRRAPNIRFPFISDIS
jgi:hypothetical protein